jgi:hypothetical protein
MSAYTNVRSTKSFIGQLGQQFSKDLIERNKGRHLGMQQPNFNLAS